MAYYCFVKLGWPPSQYNNLPPREKRLVAEFAIKNMEDEKKLRDQIGEG